MDIHEQPESGQSEEAARLASGRKPAHAVIEFCGVAAFVCWAARIALRLCTGLVTICSHPRPATTFAVCLGHVGGALILGVLAADVVSGTVHWAADNWGSEALPGLGPAVIRPFRHHHVDAHAITHHDFLELNGNNFIAGLPLLWWAAAALPSSSSPMSLAGQSSSVRYTSSDLATAAFWLSFALCVGLTNQIHCWAHMRDPPPVVRVLQDCGLLLSRPHHHTHHVRPHDRNYCITTGWMNGPLSALRFFETLEWAITATTGAVPLHEQLHSK